MSNLVENSVIFWGLLALFVVLAIAIIRQPDINIPAKVTIIILTASVVSCSLLIRDIVQSKKLDKLNWKSFVQEHNCKVVERGVLTGGVFQSVQTGWLCDDGVKYYKPEWFEIQK